MAEDIPFLPIEQFKGVQELSNLDGNEQIDNSFLKQYGELPPNVSIEGRVTCSYEVALLLHGMGMEKFIDNFRKHNITLKVFHSLEDEDLIEIGVDDPEDRQKILKNLNRPTSTRCSTVNAPHNTFDDLLISKNLLNQTILINNHLSILIKKIEKSDLSDYFVNKDVKASYLAEVVLNKSVEQVSLICNNIGSPIAKEGLLSTILKKQKLTLPKSDLDKMFKKKKISFKKIFLALLSTVGICSFAVLLSGL